MLANDYVRCKGATSVRGVSLPCCVKCERRIFPKDVPVFVAEYKPQQVSREWVCEARIAYES